MKKVLVTLFAIALLSGCGAKGNASLDDKEALLEFVYQDMLENSEGEIISKEDFMSSNTLAELITDFNGDGVKDDLVYSDFESGGVPWASVSLVTVENGEFKMLPTEIEDRIAYKQDFSIEEGMLIRTIDEGGTGALVQDICVYELAEDNIYNTDGYFIVNSKSNFQGVEFETTGKKTGDWKSFIYELETKNVTNSEITETSKTKYFFNEQTHKYESHLISSFVKAEEEYIYPREKVLESEFKNTEFYKNAPTASYSEYIESNENRKLTGLEAETFGNQTIDFNEYFTVVVPMYTSVNNKFTDKRTVSFNDNSEKQFKVTVFGEIEDVRISQTDLNGIEQQLNLRTDTKITNTEITINADGDSILFTGRINLGEGTYQDVNIILDNTENQKVVTNE